jgi:hypothetical protein
LILNRFLFPTEINRNEKQCDVSFTDAWGLISKNPGLKRIVFGHMLLYTQYKSVIEMGAAHAE